MDFVPNKQMALGFAFVIKGQGVIILLLRCQWLPGFPRQFCGNETALKCAGAVHSK